MQTLDSNIDNKMKQNNVVNEYTDGVQGMGHYMTAILLHR